MQTTNKKYLWWLLPVALWLAWVGFARTFLWQRIFGQPMAENAAELPLVEEITLLPQNRQQTVLFGDYAVRLDFRAAYQVRGRAVYVDIYDSGFHLGFKSEQDKANELYNAVSPLDLSLFVGATAAADNWQKIDVSHEYRVIIWEWQYKDNPIVNQDEISNNHIIPANNNIRRGFDTIKKGDIVFLSGYLLDWQPVGEYAYMDMKTALTPGEIADFKLGGKTSSLCRYFYVEQLQVRGFVYQ